MSVLSRIDRIRNAGLAWSARAISTRLLRKLQGISPARAFLDRRWRVTPESLDQFIDFGANARGDLVGCFVNRVKPRHFIDNPRAVAETVSLHFPEAVAQTIEQADLVCEHRFSLLGRDATFGEHIDWFWVPDTNTRWPVLHAEDYPKGFYNAPDRHGDIKHPWELNRHQYWVTLGKAYCHTGDEKYAREFTNQLLSWCRENPFRRGINWHSEMEMGIRLISWSTAFQFFRSSSYFQENGLRLFLSMLYQQARYLRRRLTIDWLSANNHLLGETAGLFAFGVLFPQFRESSAIRAEALSIFADALERQIFRDGVNREQATGYHRFVVDFVFVVVRLAQLNDIELPMVVTRCLEKMLEYEAAITPPNGLAPQIGDCDDGRGLFLSESTAFFDFRGWVAAGAWQFQRLDMLRASRGGNEETAWLLGTAAWESLRAMKPADTPRASEQFTDGGHCILRTGDAERDTHIHVRCGEFGLGLDGSSAHSHCDILAPIVFVRGEPLLIDRGTYAYLLESDARDALRSTASHNTMAPRGAEQARMFPIWNWGKVPCSRVVDWHVDADGTRMRGECRTFEGFTHWRTIELEAHSHRITIEDRLEADESCTCIDAYLHFAEHVVVKRESAGAFEAFMPSGAKVKIEVDGFNDSCVLEDWFSPSYAVRCRNSTLRLTVDGRSANTVIRIVPEL